MQVPVSSTEVKFIQKKRDLEDGIWVTEDLIWEDREAKKKLKEVMKEAFENGKKSRFSRGKLYIEELNIAKHNNMVRLECVEIIISYLR